MQKYDGLAHPMTYHSRMLKAPELNYTTVEKECLAVDERIKKFHFCVLSSKLTIETGHMLLTSLHSSKIANANLTRWTQYLQQLNFILKYIKGPDNVPVDVDLLSRLIEGSPEVGTT